MGEIIKRRKHRTPRPVVASKDAISYNIRQAMEVTGLGKTRLYELLHEGRLRAIKDGARTLIVGDSLRAYLASLPEWSPARAA